MGVQPLLNLIFFRSIWKNRAPIWARVEESNGKKSYWRMIKLQLPAGQANPSPPVGPALGQHGVNIMEFCKAFNAKTQGDQGLIIPVVITVYSDRSFSFITKTPPASVLLLKAAGLQKGSGEPHLTKVGKVTKAQVREIAELKWRILTPRILKMPC